MSDFFRTALVLFLTVAPLGAVAAFASASEAMERPRLAFACALSAFALLAGTALLADSFLDWINVSAENFQLAAALLVLPHGFHLIVRGNSMNARTREDNESLAWFLPLTVPLLVSPASVAATISYASRFGSGTAITAGALVLGLTAAILAGTSSLSGFGESRAISTINRFSGALLIALAVELAVDGIRSV